MDRKDRGAWFMGWLVTRKGSDTSGNYGHKGVKGRRGGSAPGGGHGVIGITAGMSAEDFREKLALYQYEQLGLPGMPDFSDPMAGKAPPEVSDTDDVEPALEEMLNDLIPERSDDYDYYDEEENEGDYAEPEAITWDTIEDGSNEEGTVIDQGAENAADESGYDAWDHRQLADEWNNSSNGTVDAISLQEAASEEFELPMSKYQEQQRMKFPGEGQFEREQERGMLRGIYDATQDTLDSYGIKEDDTVQLFRGCCLPSGSDIEKGDEILLGQNVMSSWSMGLEIAYNFSDGIRERPSGVIVMDVPRSAILAYAGTGMGTVHEGEFVVLGIPGARARVLDTSGL